MPRDDEGFQLPVKGKVLKLLIVLIIGIVIGVAVMQYGGHALVNADEIQDCQNNEISNAELNDAVDCYLAACPSEAIQSCSAR
jgi:hypothetical protein